MCERSYLQGVPWDQLPEIHVPEEARSSQPSRPRGQRFSRQARRPPQELNLRDEHEGPSERCRFSQVRAIYERCAGGPGANGSWLS
jgi:hypothetical protein